MKELTIGKNEAGQRLDKFLAKYLNLAGKSFLYKMMRKKNITLNGKKCAGSESLSEGDSVKLFLSDETIEKFSDHKVQNIRVEKRPALKIIYEDDDIMLINKPAGMLSQKAKETDESLVEYLISYLLEKGSITEEDLKSFRPSVCNRLDRNTSGIVAAGKTLAGLQMLSEVFRDRSIHKYYQCLILGSLPREETIDGWLEKDEAANKVTIYKEQGPQEKERQRIITAYKPLMTNGEISLIEVTLLTGRSHQIRAHLASIGHPIIGDSKYGNPARYAELKRDYRIRVQQLHSYKLVFPKLTGKFSYLSGKVFETDLPVTFHKIIDGEGLYQRS